MASSNKGSHFGTAGEYFAMSELLLRGWNVAVPVVDVGDDVLVIDDNDKTTFRVQVKSAHATRVGKNARIRARFTISRAQLRTDQQVELFYMLVIRHEASWQFLVIPRARLFEIHDAYVSTPSTGPGRPPKAHDSARSDALGIDVVIGEGEATAWNSSLSEYLNDWPSELPRLDTGPGRRGLGRATRRELARSLP